MDFLHHLIDTLRHLNPEHVSEFATYCGPWLYVVLFAIIFCETGLVVLPFLPGDSLLFAIGAVTATSSSISFPLVAVLLCVAANSGDLVNYLFGYNIGPKVFSSESSKLLNKKHLKEAQEFYAKYGKMTIILARFVPIIRTFAPFVAGIGKMNFFQFAGFSIIGGATWVLVCLSAGYKLAKVEFVQKHFEVVVLAVIFVSLIPPVVQFLKSRRKNAEPMPVV